MIKCDYLRNFEVLRDPSEKNDISHSHYNFKQINGTVHDMVMDNVAGHQIIPGEFVWMKHEDGRDILRSKVCWRSGNIIIAEFDKDVPYYTLEDVIEDDEFIRENAYALTHSVSSYYNGNGLRYRVWFVLSYTGGTSNEEKDVRYKLETWEFAKEKILERYSQGENGFPVADRNGSRVTSGGYGLFGAKYLVLGNEVSIDIRKEWAKSYKEWTENRKEYSNNLVEADSFEDIPKETLRELKEMQFRSDGKDGEVSIGYIRCILGGNHEDDDSTPRTVVFKKKNRLTFYCHKCPDNKNTKTFRKKLTRNDIIRKVRDGQMPHLALSRPPSKLQIQDSDIVYGKIEDNREAISEFLDSETRVLGIGGETGGGKTEAAINYSSKGDICLVLPTHKLGDDIEKRLIENDYQIWKARHYGYAKNESDMEIYEDDLPPHNMFGVMDKICVSPRKCGDYGDKGGEVIKTICSSCPVYLDCKESGYLSQFETFPNRQIQIIKMKDVFTDPKHRGFAKQIIGASDRIAFVDEAKAHDFYNKTELSKRDIKKMADIWKGKEVGDLCEYFIDNWHDYDKWKDMLIMSESIYQDIMHQLSSVRCIVKSTRNVNDDYFHKVFKIELRGMFEDGISREGSAYMPKDEDSFDYLTGNGQPVLYASSENTDLTLSLDQCVKMNLMNMDYVESMPKVYNSENNWYSELTRSVQHYDALVKLESDTEDVIVFATPPVIFEKLNKLVAMSATLDEYHFSKAFSGYKTEFLNPPRTPFNSQARLFQLRTGTTPIGYWEEEGEIASHALNKLEIIEDKINSEPQKKYCIITSEKVINIRKDVWAEMEPFIEYTHFGNTEGLNEMFKEIDVIIIIGSFQLPPKEIRNRSMMLFGNEKEILSFVRYRDDNNNTFYEDDRVQSVQNQAVIGELIQDIGRGRLNLYGKYVILLSSYKIPNYSERAHLFDMADLEVAHTFSGLQDIIESREEEESNMSDAEKKALEMYKAGKGNSEVRNETGLSLYVLKNLRKKHNIVTENKYRKEIRIFLYHKRESTLDEIAQQVNLPKNKLQYHVNQMLKENIISRVKHGVYKYGS